MSVGVLTISYLIAGVLFIQSLGGLSQQETARRGNLFGIGGMVLAIVVTIGHPLVQEYVWVVGTIAAGSIVGAAMANRVAMTAMPQMVAMLHSFVGLAAVLVGLSTHLRPGHGTPSSQLIHSLEIYADIGIGAVTFTGSVIAWAKLQGHLSGTPLLLPGRHKLNAVAVTLIGVLAIPYVQGHEAGTLILVVMALIAGGLGAHLVLAIGGADMPVVVSLLNSYSGWTAAAAGFMLSNDLLIVTGALVGSSGAILSYIMCKAMNRSIWSVVFGGFGTGDSSSASGASDEDQGEVQAIDTLGLKELLSDAQSVIIVPGYGMAVARAQNAVRELCELLKNRGIEVRFAIHPVAGRLPGHMNVLLAEAGVPYDIVLEMDEINEDMPRTDVALVIGANDIVNPSAQLDPDSPIAGMPTLEVWKASTCVVLKRGLSTGYAGVNNPLFFMPGTRMYFGDARESMEKIVFSMKAY